MAVDSVDGTLARAVGVRRVLPGIDGRRLDDVVDFFNYALVPVVFLVAGGYLVHVAWAALPVLASAYGFSQEKAKTDDGFFLGFPSYWNVLAIFAWLLEVSALTCTAFVMLFSVLVFVPLQVRLSELPARAQAHDRRAHRDRGGHRNLRDLRSRARARAPSALDRARLRGLLLRALVLAGWPAPSDPVMSEATR